MPYFMGLFTVLVPLLKFFTGAVAMVVIYDIITARIWPLFTMAQNRLSQEVGVLGGGGGSSQFGEIFVFFDIERGVTVLVSAIIVGLAWKIVIFAARSMASRAAPGI